MCSRWLFSMIYYSSVVTRFDTEPLLERGESSLSQGLRGAFYCCSTVLYRTNEIPYEPKVYFNKLGRAPPHSNERA
jgi:hypothetical protein